MTEAERQYIEDRVSLAFQRGQIRGLETAKVRAFLVLGQDSEAAQTLARSIDALVLSMEYQL